MKGKPLQAQAAEKPIGPTPEQLAKGGYERPTERGSLAVYTNRHPDIMAKLLGHGTISDRQFRAGRAFEATYANVWGSPTPARDSTVERVGGAAHETEAQAEWMGRNRARLHTILQRVKPRRYNLLINVCCFGFAIGRDRGRNAENYAELRAGLDECAVVYGIT